MRRASKFLFVASLILTLAFFSLSKGYGSNGNLITKKQIIEYFLEIAFGAEYGDSTSTRIVRWVENPRIKVNGNPTEDDLRCLKNAVKDISDLAETIDLEIVDNNANINIFFIPESQFQKYDNYVPTNYGFFWCWWNGRQEIYKARILISTEGITQKERCHLIREELTQSLGLGEDSERYKDSIFYQGWTDVMEFSQVDKQIIKLLYSREISPGLTVREVKKILKYK